MADHIQIGDVSPRIQYTANGVVAVYTYPYPIFEDADLLVYLNDTLQTAGYTVSGAGQSSGGSVTFAMPPADGVTVTLARLVPEERTTDFQEGGAFRAKVINEELDRIVCMVQQIREDVGRSVSRPATSTSGASLALPDPVAGKSLKWSAAGDALVNSDVDPDGLASAVIDAEAARDAAQAAAGDAATSETHAAASAQAADNSAVMAQSYAASIGKTETVTGDATITITDNGTLWTVLATSPVTITLPLISEAGEPFLARIKRDGASTADVTVSPSGTDQIGGAASLVLDGADQGVQCFADIDATPDNWEVGEFGPGVSAALETRVAQNETDIAANAAAIASLKAGTAVLYEYGPDGENAGATVAGAWTPRGINLKAVVSKPFVSVSGHKFTLLPGKYRIRTKSPFIYCNGSRTRLYDETHAAVVDGSLSLSVQSGGTSYYFQPSYAEGVCEVVIAEATTCFVDYIASVAYALGLGCHDALAAGEEYFGRIEIERLA